MSVSPVGTDEVAILTRVFGDEASEMAPEAARSILDLRLGERDRARMHDLAARNQEDRLGPGEKEELAAFAKATTLLSIWKSKARRTLRIDLEARVDP